MLLHWTRILSFISVLLLWMGFSQALRGGGSELSTDKEPHSQTPSSPIGDFPQHPGRNYAVTGETWTSDKLQISPAAIISC